MLRKILHGTTRLAVVLLLAALLVFGLPQLIAGSYALLHLSSVEATRGARVAIVFGAGLQRDGTPSPVLRDRVETAAQLYFSGKVEKLLMSGDNRFVNYNEPGAMREYALQMGVPIEDIVLDYAGRRTYDTCYRANFIFGVRDALLVTQRFHLARALFICNSLGVNSIGVPADQRTYSRRSLAYWTLREVAATSMAFWEVWISRPMPVLGVPEPIFSDESSSAPGAIQSAPTLSNGNP